MARDRENTAALLAHIAEVDARELFLPAACSSMFVYCTRVLRLSEDVAYKRIQASRAARRFPLLLDAIADGRLHVTGAVMLAPHLTDANVEDVIAAATHKTRTELEMLVAALAPRADLPERLVPVDPPAPQRDPDPVPARQLDPDPVPPPPARVKPLAPERFGLQLTISGATHDKLARAQALLRHANPTGDLADVIDRALDALLDKLAKKKFGATFRPRATKARKEDANPRYSTSEVKRGVHERDGEQCAFVSKDGVRCTADAFLELDHEDPVCLGGQPTVEKMRLYCRAHNQYAADLRLGADFMRARREAARATRATRASAAVAHSAPAPAERASATGRAPFDSDVTLALVGMGFKREETRRALVASADAPAATLEERLRAALAYLARTRGSGCAERAFDRLRCRADAFAARVSVAAA